MDVARCRSMSVRVTSGSLCTRTALGCDIPPMPQVAGIVPFVVQPPGRPMTGGRLRPLTGATHPFGVPGTARRRLGCARPSQPRPGSLPDQQSLAGRPSKPAFRGRLRPCAEVIASGPVAAVSERDVPAHLEERQGAPGGFAEV